MSSVLTAAICAVVNETALSVVKPTAWSEVSVAICSNVSAAICASESTRTLLVSKNGRKIADTCEVLSALTLAVLQPVELAVEKADI